MPSTRFDDLPTPPEDSNSKSLKNKAASFPGGLNGSRTRLGEPFDGGTGKTKTVRLLRPLVTALSSWQST